MKRFIPFYRKNNEAKSFLKAQWRHLAFANYEVSPDVLQPYLPAGTELDLWNGKCYLSLVAFLFLETKVFGVKVPGHVNFEEVNIRFYVKRLDGNEWKRGVVFVKEIVPRSAIAFIANTFYREKYERLPMMHEFSESDNSKTYKFGWRKNVKWNSFSVDTKKSSADILEGSETEFITEHYFGYSRQTAATSFEYEVKHPRWQQFEVTDYKIDVDFEAVYGNDFAFLKDLEPVSVFLADGSNISVENKIKITN
ncbi:MAG: DUF2071 domain-containing protein [Flavobacterium sp.]|uniref:YqjF family protein n=1 Tax=Flavobacterium sp. TaxID=239 RepID=UPI00122422E3|nr:DUF2071 domain-containing protein [Flavobacterium sp.]RZJ64441.1 MAG: DUF2071 domain-containing protein [Flavobacterium sp.]